MPKVGLPERKEKCSTNQLKTRIKKYFEGYEEALPSVLEAILRRKLAGKHKETDDELMDELEVQPRVDVDDEKFESNFTNLYSTGDEEDSSLGQTPPRMISLQRTKHGAGGRLSLV
ncbi:hypothetical protein GOBAR_DD17925 [Gossypium barbadense]|nr:hypothetical protein GOBAR_DD17925 [Gossypium barbadense]